MANVTTFRTPWTKQPPNEVDRFDRVDTFGRRMAWAIIPGWYPIAPHSDPTVRNGAAFSVGDRREFLVAHSTNVGGHSGSLQIIGKNYGAGLGPVKTMRVDTGNKGQFFKLFLNDGDLGLKFAQNDNITVVGIYQPLGNGRPAGAGDPRLFSKDEGSSEVNHDLMIGQSVASPRTRIRINGSTKTVVPSGTVQSDAMNLVAGIVEQRSATTWRVRCEHIREDGGGNSAASATDSAGYTPRTTTSTCLGGTSESSDNAITGDILGIWAFNAALSREELFELFKNPWRVFEPEDIPIYVPAGGGSVLLTVADALHGHTVDAPVLSQANVLIIADALHSQAVDNLALVQAHQLAVADALHGHTADNVELSQSSLLELADTLHSQAVDNLALVQAHQLVVADALHSHTVDNVELSQSILLELADALHSQAVDNLALVQAHQLAVADALHSQAADNVELSQSLLLAVADALHSHTADNVALTQANVLAVADALHSHAADLIALTQANTLAVSETVHSVTVDSPTLSQSLLLAVADALHSSSVDPVTLTQAHVLAVADATMAMLAANIDLSQAGTLIVDDALHASLVDHITLGEPPTAKAHYIFVKARDRRIIIRARDRRIIVH